MHFGALVTFGAAVRYFFLRECWVLAGISFLVYLYNHWTTTVLLMVTVFYGILPCGAAGPRPVCVWVTSLGHNLGCGCETTHMPYNVMGCIVI